MSSAGGLAAAPVVLKVLEALPRGCMWKARAKGQEQQQLRTKNMHRNGRQQMSGKALNSPVSHAHFRVVAVGERPLTTRSEDVTAHWQQLLCILEKTTTYRH
jgi:hypothetical protein